MPCRCSDSYGPHRKLLDALGIKTNGGLECVPMDTKCFRGTKSKTPAEEDPYQESVQWGLPNKKDSKTSFWNETAEPQQKGSGHPAFQDS